MLNITQENGRKKRALDYTGGESPAHCGNSENKGAQVAYHKTIGGEEGEVERFHRQIIGSITSCEIVITDFVPAADRAYLAGFVSLGFGKGMLLEIFIIKETGSWKWFGNQK